MSRFSDLEPTQQTSSTSQTCWFLSPQRKLAGHGAVMTSADLPGMTWREQIATMLEVARKNNGPEIVMGAIPFWSDCPTALVLPQHTSELSSEQVSVMQRHHVSRMRPLPALQVQSHDHAAYERSVRQVLSLIDRGLIRKLVLSREVDYEATEKIDTQAVLSRLLFCHPSAYVFSVPLSYANRTGVFIGASPELLVSRQGSNVHAMPLAGSIAAEDDPAQNAARTAALQTSQKDRLEHAYTADAVMRTLSAYCENVTCPETPEVVRAGSIHHLASPISGIIRSPKVSSIDLAEALHPTPAVGGVPQKNAAQRIREIEGRPRGLYAGMVGWCDSDGNGEWALSLRCAEVSGRTAKLFAGGGIVSGSEPAAEFAETETKLSTMLAALNLMPRALSASEMGALQPLEDHYG